LGINLKEPSPLDKAIQLLEVPSDCKLTMSSLPSPLKSPINCSELFSSAQNPAVNPCALGIRLKVPFPLDKATQLLEIPSLCKLTISSFPSPLKSPINCSELFSLLQKPAIKPVS
jgi:hypothetical protein